MTSTPNITPYYLGREYASFYLRLWIKKEHILRRVDTYHLLDTEGVRQSITFDIDNHALQNIEKEELKCAEDPCVKAHPFSVPVILLDKKPLFDVDLRGAQGQAIHLCRRYENIAVSAHILVGQCLALGYTGKVDSERSLFNAARRALGYGRGSSEVDKQKSSQAFINEAKKGGIGKSIVKLESLVELLSDHYIQCIEHAPASDRTVYIVKLQFTSMSLKQGDLARSTKPKQPLSGLALSGIENDEMIIGYGHRSILPPGLARLSRWIGTSAPRIKIGIGEEIPNHIRVVSAHGTTIDDVVVVGEQQGYLIGINDGVLIERHRERASVILREMLKQKYEVLVTLNARRGNFLIPGLVVSFLQLVIMLIAMFVGPEIVSRNAIAFTGTSLIAPFVSALFLTKENEHELVSKIVNTPRMLLLLSSIMAVFSGAFLSLLPKPEACASSFPRHTPHDFIAVLCFVMLSATVILAILCVVLFLSTIWRIGKMRRIVYMRDTAIKEGVKWNTPKKKIIDTERSSNRWVVWQFAAVLIMIVAAIVTLGYIVAPYAVNLWIGE